LDGYFQTRTPANSLRFKFDYEGQRKVLAFRKENLEKLKALIGDSPG